MKTYCQTIELSGHPCKAGARQILSIDYLTGFEKGIKDGAGNLARVPLC